MLHHRHLKIPRPKYDFLVLSVMYLRLSALSDLLLIHLFLLLGLCKVFNSTRALQTAICPLLPSSTFGQSDNGKDVGCVDKDFINLFNTECGCFWVEEVD